MIEKLLALDLHTQGLAVFIVLLLALVWVIARRNKDITIIQFNEQTVWCAALATLCFVTLQVKECESEKIRLNIENNVVETCNAGYKSICVEKDK